jgi:hypothetical protein
MATKPSAPRQTFGDMQAEKMTAERNKMDGQRAAQQAMQMSQSRQAAERMAKFGGADGRFGQGSSPMPNLGQQAQQNMAPGTGGRGTQQEYAARMQQRATPSSMEIRPPAPRQTFGSQMAAKMAAQTPPPGVPQYGPQTQPPPAILGNRGMAGGVGPSTQTGGPAPMGMAPPNAANVGMFKKGGAVRYAGGGKTEEKKEAPIPAETIASMRRQAAQEKADRKQAEEQKAGEKEVKENMGRLGFKNGGSIKASKMGAVKTAKPTMRSASSRADGIAIRGKTRA